MAEAPVTERSGFGWSRPDVGTPERSTEYRTFPRKIPVVLVSTGSAIAFIGALGGWIRATQVRTGATDSQLVGTLWGYADRTGRAIAILAVVTLFIGFASYFTTFLPKFALEASAVVLSAVLLTRLLSLDSQTGALTAAARQNPSFEAYNAGFSWGAWLMMLGLVLVALGALVGGLRHLDLKRGKPE